MTTSYATIEPRHFRDVMGHLPTGVVVVAGHEVGTGKPVGLAVGTFQSLSLDPPLVSFGVATTSRSWPRIRLAGRFGASILAAGQEDVCHAMSDKREDRFASVGWHESAAGNPLISGAHAWIECRIARELDGGDHDIVIAEVCHLEAGDGEPLVFHRGRLGAYRDLRS